MRLSDLILEYVLTQKDLVSFYDEIKNPEETFKKKSLKLKYRISSKDEKAITSIDGEKETNNVAHKGDFIVSGVKGEKYVLTPEKISQRYTIVDNNTVATKPVEIKAKVYTGKDIQFKASWGENMILKDGDILVKNKEEYYRIEKNVFPELYEKIS